jgi:hypothetical protein
VHPMNIPVPDGVDVPPSHEDICNNRSGVDGADIFKWQDCIHCPMIDHCHAPDDIVDPRGNGAQHWIIHIGYVVPPHAVKPQYVLLTASFSAAPHRILKWR